MYHAVTGKSCHRQNANMLQNPCKASGFNTSLHNFPWGGGGGGVLNHIYSAAEVLHHLGVHYNHCVSPSVRPLAVRQNAHNSLTTWLIMHTYACQHCQNTGMRNSLFYGRGLAEHQSGRLWSVCENAHNS